VELYSKINFANVGVLIALIGVGFSLLWNLVNWRRNKILDKLTQRNAAAIRFEAVHGDTLRQVLELIDEVGQICEEIRQVSDNIVDIKSKIKQKLKPLISISQNKLTLMVLGLGTSPLSRDKEKWKFLGPVDK